MSACLFCKIAKGEIPAQVVYENEAVMAFRDIAPQAPVHLLVIPKKHIGSLQQLEAEDRAHYLPEIFHAIQQLAEAHGLGDGYRVINNCGEHGGQTVEHLHFHLLGGKQLPLHLG